MTNAPVLDIDVLGRLEEQLGDPDMLRGFIRGYESTLDQRVERLHRALSTQDHDDWMDAILSLKTSSAMVGAEALSQLALQLQDNVTPRPPAPACWPVQGRIDEIMDSLRQTAAETTRQLRHFVARMPEQNQPGNHSEPAAP